MVDFRAASRLAFRAVPQQTTAAHSNFEATHDPSLTAGWVVANATLVAATSVAVDVAGGGGAIAGLRYAWPNVPRGRQLYDDAAGLPAAPFLARCAEGGGCELVEGGKVPV